MRQNRYPGNNDEYYQLGYTPAMLRTDEWRQLGHDRRQDLSGCIPLTIHCVSNVYVGTGDYELNAAKRSLYLPFARRDGRLYIPGTTIKGVVRSYAEALSPSCGVGDRCQLPKEDTHRQLCFACTLFGALGFQGRVTFCDTASLPAPKTPQLYSMSVRWTGKNDEGRRFYYHDLPASPQLLDRNGNRMADEQVEIVPRGTEFSCSLLFDRLSRKEMGLLLLALGLSDTRRFALKLGGGKDRRLGSVRFEATQGIHLQSATSYEQFDEDLQVESTALWGATVVSDYLAALSESNQEWPSLIEDTIRCFRDDRYGGSDAD